MNFHSLTNINFNFFILNKLFQLTLEWGILSNTLKKFRSLCLHLPVLKSFFWICKTSNSDSSDLVHYQSSQLIKHLTFVNLFVLKKQAQPPWFSLRVLHSCVPFPPSAVGWSAPRCPSSPGCWLSICCWGFPFSPAIPHSCVHLLVSLLAQGSLELRYLRQFPNLTITHSAFTHSVFWNNKILTGITILWF